MKSSGRTSAPACIHTHTDTVIAGARAYSKNIVRQRSDDDRNNRQVRWRMDGIMACQTETMQLK